MIVALDLRTGGFNQFIVLYTGGTGGNAGHTAEALIDMGREGGVDADIILRDHLHQLDATAWRVHFLAPERIGRAGGETEAAVHAVGEQFGIGRVMVVEGCTTCFSGRANVIGAGYRRFEAVRSWHLWRVIGW